jgi:hypothetical protein
VIEPGMDPNEWDPSDPKFQRLTKQLVWAVKTRPAPEATGSVRLCSYLISGFVIFDLLFVWCYAVDYGGIQMDADGTLRF